ncbi:hypothetical protein SISNIDRAFT_488016 [Sistotremastrum niveocremeum HHB9708]|uniref:F-box domain-containing protein n=2 Tax=Sistotremastraceae TaxID=3402574 RepID=A0A164RN63_9AGAM|nr:hypothetical protein SISNIDRAFT_488016 [Sistotremastrum niveocremeum HHB9708]KZT33610.1 hypothetical protein SISSUDRAFT_1066010 [Sistotremastrum suecicum HHB10207 ss-3]
MDEDTLRDLFSGDAPKLRDISTEGASHQALNPGSFHSLVSLALDTCYVADAEQITRFPSILAQTPRLVELSIGGDVSATWPYLPVVTQPIAELRECINCGLSGFSADQTAYLLSAISLPIVQVLEIWAQARVIDDVDTTSAFSCLPPAVKVPFSKSETLTFSLEDEGVVLYSEVEDLYTLEFSESHYHMEHLSDVGRALRSFIVAPMQVLNLAPESLAFSSGDRLEESLYTQDFWKAILLETPHVTEISIRGTVPTPKLIAALRDPDLVCPFLKTLILETKSRVHTKALKRCWRIERSAMPKSRPLSISALVAYIEFSRVKRFAEQCRNVV